MTKATKQRGLIVSSASIFSTQALFMLFNAAAQIILARGLGPEDRGLFALATLFPQLVMEVAGVGIAWAVIYFIGKKRASDEDVIGTAFTFSLMWGVLITALTVLASPVLFPFAFRGVDPVYLYIALSLLPLLFGAAVLNNTMLAKGALFRYGLLNNLRAVGLLLAILVVLAASLPHLLGFFAGWIISSMVAAIAPLFLSKNLYKLRFTIRWQLLKDMLSYGVKVQLTGVLLFLSRRIDLLLVAGLAGTKAAGIYAVTIALSEVIWQVPAAMSIALYTRVSASTPSENLSRMPVVTRNALFLTLLACTPFILFGDFLIGVTFGPKFLPVVDALLILVPGIVLYGGAKMLTNYFIGTERTGTPNIAAAACLISMVALDFYLIPAHGVNGAAAAASVAYALYTCVMLAAYARHSPHSLRSLVLIKISDFKIYLAIFGRLKRRPILTEDQ